MTRPMLEEREKLEPCPKLREAIENGHLRCSVSVGVGSPVATIDTEDLWRLVHAAERSLSASASERGLREALGELLAADDAMAAFIIAVEPAVLGETEWQQQHRERSARRRKAIASARAALSPKGEDEQARAARSASTTTGN